MKRRRKTGTTMDKMITSLAHRLPSVFHPEQASIAEFERTLSLYPAKGYWRQVRADVMQFTGSFEHNGLLHTIECWESMTTCLRNGYELRRGKCSTEIECSSRNAG